ncbi:MAG: 4Fe-4S dicluster domain-containing protein [Alsobacter sp.]
MDAAFSRRAVLRALVAHRSEADRPTRLLAQIGPTCVERHRVACRSCADMCDTRAIRFRPIAGGGALPTVSGDLCTGCGTCAGSCPVGAVTLVDADRATLARSLTGSMGQP